MAERNKTIIEDKSFEFAVKIVGTYKYLSDNRKEYVLLQPALPDDYNNQRPAKYAQAFKYYALTSL